MEQRSARKAWRMEVKNPLDPLAEWRTTFEFNDDQLLTYQELGKELDQANSLVQHRIVGNSTSD